MTRPLTAIAHAAESLPAHEGVQLAVQPGLAPELLDLVTGFNRLSTRLRESRAQQHELIASLNERVAAATEEGLRAERLVTLGAIAAGFAHEMGNSLHVITGFTAVALRELPAEHANRADLEAVKKETSRATALLDRFLFFARARSARPAPTAVEPLVREAIEVLRPAAAEARVTTEITIEPDLPPVRLDAELIRQAFLNLAVNALQAMKGGGRLRVRVLQHGRGVAVEFHDTGPGVDAAVLDHVFEPFFTTKPEGTGLGLAIVRQAAEVSGGSVSVESPPGGGALFRVCLPAAPAAQAAA
jgi:signal transduction histidine kinase